MKPEIAQHQKTLLVMAGGTGGHIMPALAVSETLRSEGWRVVWMGNETGMEGRLIPARNFETAWIRFGALRGKGGLQKLLLPLNLLRGFWQAANAIRRVKPNVVLGFGGYVTFPGGMMASLLNKPFVIHEQNAIAGLANRVLSKVADRVLCGFPKALGEDSQWVGNPVRASICALPSPIVRWSHRQGPLSILVVGGSLGAAALNEVVPKALSMLPSDLHIQVLHQAGEKHLANLQKNYANATFQVRCVTFIDDMAAAYADADVVICRSGALTVAELAAAGCASILVPFPHAVDDHQTRNARFLSDKGAALLVPQNEMTPEHLVKILSGLSRDTLREMAEKAKSLAKPEATDEVARICKDIAQ